VYNEAAGFFYCFFITTQELEFRMRRDENKFYYDFANAQDDTPQN